jgi:hypothetical protein
MYIRCEPNWRFCAPSLMNKHNQANGLPTHDYD